MPLASPSHPTAGPALPQLQTAPPRIGQEWPEAGGLYAGIARGKGDEPDAHLVLHPGKPDDKLTWQEAIDWAATVAGGGWHLPTRDESALLYAHLRDQFQGWHWTSTQYSRDDAWLQDFDYGFQVNDLKSRQGLARAVRRFSLQSLSPSSMPATPHGSVTSAVLRTPAFDPWLTTADIGTFAAERLAQTRAWAADQRAKAIAHAGQQEALDCALRIDVFKGWCDNVAVLGLLASRQGDHATATAIEADVASTTRLLIEQSHTARMLSVPGWNLATRSFAAPEPAPQVVQ